MPRPPPYHVELLQKVGEKLTGIYEQKLRVKMIGEGFPAGRLEKKTSVELLWLLDRKRIIAPNKYDKLKEMLHDIGRQDLVDQYLGGTDFSDLYHIIYKNIVSEAELSRMANEFGPEWKSFGIEHLEMRQCDLEQCTSSDPVAPVRDHIFNMLLQWKYREGKKATRRCLKNKLEKHGVDQSCIRCLDSGQANR